MEFLSFPSYEALSQEACERTLRALRRKPDLILCPASGNSPLLTYQLLGDYARQHPDLFQHLRIVQLDEFFTPGLPTGRGAEYMETYLIQPLGVSADRYLGFQTTPDPEAEARRFAEQLAAWGRIDLSLLGMGLNGHLGLVEPADELALHTHVAQLHPSSRQHHMVSDLTQAPETGMTMGIGDMLSSREVLLLVNGTHKQQALKEWLSRKVRTRFPASLLWLHPNSFCLADQEALA